MYDTNNDNIIKYDIMFTVKSYNGNEYRIFCINIVKTKTIFYNYCFKIFITIKNYNYIKYILK